ncbi:repair protein [Toxoplasma gondii RUB]|uniref:Repair protein n=3 Tax=Toxoplasma gondii TaxID=5811 RepID=A0A086LT12_TOXGO|nr:repair protein [Toxoplasma gondii RUB]KFH04340.1 repair protein [Toxoplasma gondii VAND]PUA87189.1 repair protein [Toxoplasma gondii TgCATBr9]
MYRVGLGNRKRTIREYPVRVSLTLVVNGRSQCANFFLATSYRLFIMMLCFVLASVAWLGTLSGACADEAEGIPFKFRPHGPKLEAKIYTPVRHRIPGDEVLYNAASFPNPFVEPQKCTFSTTATHSWLCDPDHLLTPQEQSTLESRLMKLRDSTEHDCPDGRRHFYQAAVAVAHNIYVPEDQIPQQAADEMAHALLRQWGIGNRGCHDGMLLLFVKKRDLAALAKREGVEPEYITEAFTTILKARMHLAYVASQSAGDAVISGVDMLNYQLPATRAGPGWVATVIISLAALYVLSVLVVYFAISRFMMKEAHAGDE